MACRCGHDAARRLTSFSKSLVPRHRFSIRIPTLRAWPAERPACPCGCVSTSESSLKVSHRICNCLSDCESDHPTTFAQPHVDCQQQRNVWIQHLDIRIGAARADCSSLDLNWWRRDVVIFRVGRVHPGVVKLGRDLAEEQGRHPFVRPRGYLCFYFHPEQLRAIGGWGG